MRDSSVQACESLPSVLARARPTRRAVLFTGRPPQSTRARSRLICRSLQRLRASDELLPVGLPRVGRARSWTSRCRSHCNRYCSFEHLSVFAGGVIFLGATLESCGRRQRTSARSLCRRGRPGSRGSGGDVRAGTPARRCRATDSDLSLCPRHYFAPRATVRTAWVLGTHASR